MSRHLFTCTALMGGCLLSAVPALGQTSEGAATEDQGIIVVTANRRAENVQDVAASISVIGGESLAAQGVNDSNEIAQAVPNVTITSTFNTSNPRIFIRGVGSADFNPNAASPVGVYVDDVYLASTNALQFQLFDTQRVEVLRGPQGTLYGRNTTAGAIKYFSKLPTDEFEVQARLRYGNMDYASVQGALSGPIAGDALTARVSFTVDRRDGNTVNRLTGKDTGNDMRGWGARAILKFEPSADFKAVLNVHGGKSTPHTVVYKPRGTLSADGILATDGLDHSCPVAQALAGQCFDFLGYRDNGDPYSVANNVVGRERLRVYGGSLSLDKDLGFATLTSISALERTKLDRVEDSDGSPNQLLEITYDQNSKQVSQELRLTSPGGQPFNWIVGGYYFHEKVDYFNRYDLFRELRPFFIDPTNPSGFNPDAFVIVADQYVGQTTDAYAAFGRVDYELVPGLKITGGLRYTYERRKFLEDMFLTEPDFQIPVFTVPGRTSAERVSGDLILDYKVADTVMVYASVARGFKSGGFNGAVAFDPREVTSFRPETLTSYEVGIKSQTVDRRITFNASGFYYDYKDLQVYTLVNPPGGGVPVQVLDNAASAEVYGIEADTVVKITPDFALNGSLGLLHSKFKSFDSAVASADYSGNRLPRAPRMTASVGAELDLPIPGGKRIVANFDASYRSKIFFDAGNSPRLTQDAYWLANARLGLGSEDGRWTVALWGKNIFDKLYYRDVIDLSTFGFDATTISDPATYGVELSLKF